MVSEETDTSNYRGSRPYVLLDSFDNLESELALLRDSIDNLIISNRDLNLEVGLLSSEVETLNSRLNSTSNEREDNENQAPVQPIVAQAQPVEPEERPLQIGDRVRITSRQQFGVVGEVHSFTSQRVRVSVEGRRRPIIRSPTSLQRIN